MYKYFPESTVSALRRSRLLFVSIGIIFIALHAAFPAQAQTGAPVRICASDDSILFSIEYQKSIRVCSSLPIHISLWNRSEQRATILEKVVIRTSSQGIAKEFEVRKELSPAEEQLERFCQECAEAKNCGDAESCGDLYATLQQEGFQVTYDVALAAGHEGVMKDDICAGEEIVIEAFLFIGDRQVILQRQITIVNGIIPAASSETQERNDGSDAIILTGRLPHPTGWFAGDQHSHTDYEKNAGFCIWEWPDSMSSMISAAISMDLNWQIFTDHSFGIDGTIWTNAYNECSNYNVQHPGESYRCLYGEEVATGNRSNQFDISHYLSLPKNSDNVGYYDDGCSYWCNNCSSEQTVINDINNKGGLGIIAHPYDGDFSWADWSVTGYGGLEILNSLDGTWGSEDESSFNKWKELLVAGKKSIGVADSDAHYTGDVGYSFTYCQLSDMSTTSIRSAIAEGRCVFGNGPLINFEIEGAKIGDTLTACPGPMTISIDAYRGDSVMGFLDTIGIYVNNALRDEITLAEDLTEYHDLRQIDLVDADSYLYLQLQNRGASKTYKASTNPLWLNITPGSDTDGDTYTTCENDCDDNDPSVYPGAMELCDAKDNDCDSSIDEGFITPPETTGLSFALDKQTMSWNALSQADRYDVVKGDLPALRSSGGDFTSSLTGCLENDSWDTQASDSNDPDSGQGFYYLVRAQNCQSKGTYNTDQPGQIGDRDSEIEGSSDNCP